MAGTLFVVATPIGNLEDISARALRVLREATLIAAEDTRRTAHLLARYGISTPTTSLHAHNEGRKTHHLVARLLAGDNIALVSDAGTPAVSDPGAEFVRDASDHGIRVEPVPGPSAAITAISAAGITAPGFQFIGFAPTSGRERSDWVDRMRSTDLATVFFESPHRIRYTLEELLRRVGDRQVLLTRELTKIHETLVKGPISAILERIAEPVGEYTVVVWPASEDGPNPRTEDFSVSTATLVDEFGALTRDRVRTRRQAIASLSRKYRLSAGEIYRRLEEAKRSGG